MNDELSKAFVEIAKKVSMTTYVAKRLCALYGPKPDCICGEVPGSPCYASHLWGDYADWVVSGLVETKRIKLT
jgi:hypothetical protein